jgi:2-dehydropantoate 2-reductase
MRILMYGAGVIGTLYGAKLLQAGHEVVVLARGARLKEVVASGLVVEDVVTEVRHTAGVECLEALAPDDAYDLVVVPVRRDQLESVLEPLARSRGTPAILFFGNNARGAQGLTERLGIERVLLGFPGAGVSSAGRRFATSPSMSSARPWERSTVDRPSASGKLSLFLMKQAFPSSSAPTCRGG